MGVSSDPFETTQWNVVIAAGQEETAESREALAKLCEKYWRPLYSFARRKGHSVQDAQDLTQGFFAKLLEKGYLKSVQRDKGRFRSFLLMALKRYMANEWNRAQAKKRGAGLPNLSLDYQAEEGSYKLEPADKLTPERIYEKRWATTLLNEVLSRVEEEYVAAGKGKLYLHIRAFLTVEQPREPYSEVAASLAMSEGAVKVAVHRLRKRFAERLREEIAHTLADTENVEDEIKYLISVLI